jgi:hypothetical protein
MQQFERASCAAGSQMRLVVLLQAQASWEHPGVADERALEDILCTVYGKKGCWM